MARQATGHEEDCVDADRVAEFGKSWREAFGGGRHPAQAPGIERYRGGILAGALLDLDEGERAAAACDEVDLAPDDPRAARDDVPAVQPEPPRRDRFGATTPRFGSLAGQSLAPSSRARA